MKKTKFYIISLIIVFSCSKENEIINTSSPLEGEWEYTFTDTNNNTQTNGTVIFHPNGKMDWKQVTKTYNLFGGQQISKLVFQNLDWKDITEDKLSFTYDKVETSSNKRVLMIYDKLQRTNAGYFEQFDERIDLNYNYHYTVFTLSLNQQQFIAYNYCVVETLGIEEEVCSEEPFAFTTLYGSRVLDQ